MPGFPVSEPSISLAYAIAGEGRGHAAKALAAQEILAPHFRLVFFAGGDAARLLAAQGLTHEPLPSFHFGTRDGRIHVGDTVRRNWPLVWRLPRVVKEAKSRLVHHRVRLVISDFEPILPRAASALRLPCIQLSHQVVLLTAASLPGSPLQSGRARLLSGLLAPKLDQAIGVSFFPVQLAAKWEKRGVTVIPPLLRSDVLRAKPYRSGPAVVYSSNADFAWLLPILAARPEPFIIYGLGEQQRPEFPRLLFKPICPRIFLEDLICSSAVIAGGGHNLLSEAAFLGKPIASFHLEGQYEQFLNLRHLEELGLGVMIRQRSDAPRQLEQFFSELHAFPKGNFRVGCGNELLIDQLRQRLAGEPAEVN